ncbi:MAG TPA: ribosome small subunit-dependent GTPase A [Bryobacteraceae bacterium]|nr:ribosome small subunit-dependent GTPase A [Bryobacteraceae bacterium]
MKDRYQDDNRHAARDKRTKFLTSKKAQQSVSPSETGGAEGLVIGVGPGVCRLRTVGGDRVCRTRKGVIVGDRVMADEHRVLAVLPRRTVLARNDPRNPRNERALAANVDVVVIVASVTSPPLRLGLIDRYLIATQNGNMLPVVVVNKIDLLEDPRELNELKAYEEIGVPVILCSTRDGRGLEELRGLLEGKICVFTGHSGVGKSSLANALLPGLELRTGAVEFKGRHTTTASTLHELPGGTMVIDTPGIKEFGLFGVEPQDLRHFFPEFEEFATKCNFNNCTHTHEPVCAVRDANLPRYKAYLRIYETLLAPD